MNFTIWRSLSLGPGTVGNRGGVFIHCPIGFYKTTYTPGSGGAENGLNSVGKRKTGHGTCTKCAAGLTTVSHACYHIVWRQTCNVTDFMSYCDTLFVRIGCHRHCCVYMIECVSEWVFERESVRVQYTLHKSVKMSENLHSCFACVTALEEKENSWRRRRTLKVCCTPSKHLLSVLLDLGVASIPRSVSLWSQHRLKSCLTIQKYLLP